MTLRPEWTRQPQQQVPLDAGNSLSFGLSLLWTATNPTADIVGRSAGLSFGTWVPTTGPAGIGFRGEASAGTNRLEFASAPAAASSTSYTVFAYVVDDAGSSVTRNPIDSDVNAARVFQLRFKADNGVEFITFDTLGNPYFATGGALTFAPRVGLLVGRIVGNQVSVWWRGERQATGTASNTAATIANKKLIIAATYGGTHGGLITGFPGQVLLGGHYNRGLADSEIIALSQNPWQLFAPPARRIWVPTATAGSHGSSGAVVAGSATIAGTAAHFTLHPSSGALVAGSATIAGTAAHKILHTSTGALVAGSATIAGTAISPHPSSGALVASAATIAGTAARATVGNHPSTGTLVAGSATIAGTAAHKTLHTSTGALVAGSATVTGTAAHLTVHATTGVLVASAASIAGVAARGSTTHAATGALVADAATIAGTAALSILAPGGSTGAVFYIPLRLTSGVYQTGVSTTTTRPNDVAWLPSAQTPISRPNARGEHVMDPNWYRAFQHVFEVKLGGRSAPSLPDVVSTVETTQAAAVQSGQQVTALTHQSQTNAEALKATVEVVKNNSLTGSTQIPPVTLTPYDIP